MNQLRKVIRQSLDKRAPKVKTLSAFLGRADGTVRVPDRPNMVYAITWEGQLIEAYNMVVQAIAGLSVKLSYHDRAYWVDGVAQIYADPIFAGIPDGSQEQLQWPNPGMLYVHENQILPGLVLPIGGLNIYVNGAAYEADGEYRTVYGGAFNLTSYQPVSGAIYLLVAFTRAGAISFTAGVTVASRNDLTDAHIPAVSDVIPTAAIILSSDVDELVNNNSRQDIRSLRFFRFLPSSAKSATSVFSVSVVYENNFVFHNDDVVIWS
jgi:hypothetical protein